MLVVVVINLLFLESLWLVWTNNRNLWTWLSVKHLWV